MRLRHLPASLNVICAPGDLVVIQFQIRQGDDPVDISGWDMSASESDTVQIVDGPAGRFSVTLDTSSNVKRTWYVSRISPSTRRLVGADLRVGDFFERSVSPTTEFTLWLTEFGEITLEQGEAVDAIARALAVDAITHTDDQIAALAVDGGVVS